MATRNTVSLAERVSVVVPEHTNLDSAIDQFSASVEQEVDELITLRDAGESVIPEVDFGDIAPTGFDDSQQALIRKRGCVVVRGVIDEALANQWNEQLECYLRTNRYYEDLAIAIEQGDTGRAKHPNILDIYWSRTQLEIRQAQPMEEVKRHLNSLWQVASFGPGSFDANNSITYADRVRIRQPGDQTHGIVPHVDSCSLEAWLTSDSIGRNYKQLLNGDWNRFDPFVATNRVSTESKPHNDSNGVFRTYQGWMALTQQGANCGTLQLVPSSRCMGWLFLNLLRSSMRNEDLRSPLPGESFNLHLDKHAAIIEGLTSIPTMNAGDTVWWHPDVVHGVEKSNLSETNSSVVYLGNAPDCQRNRDYLHCQLNAFEKGINPPDFPPSEIESFYTDRGESTHLSSLGRQQMGCVANQEKRA